MKIRAQFLLVLVFSTTILFPQICDARLFNARLIAIEAETFSHVQLSNSDEGNFRDNDEGLSTEAAARLSQSANNYGSISRDFSTETTGKDVLERHTNDQRSSTTDHNSRCQ
jgi:hypothetical protein